METAANDRIPSVRVSIHDRGAVFLHLPTGRLFASNAVGAGIWQALAQQQDAASISAHLSREYGIPYDKASADTQQFLAELGRCGLL
jgi:hypothetical protein